MPYSVSGTTITVSGTVDLVNVNLSTIYRISFATGGATATFDWWDFMYIPPSGTYFTVTGSASKDVLIMQASDFGFSSSIDLGFFRFQNWSANDVIILNGSSGNDSLSGSYENDILRGGNGDDKYDIQPGDIVDETGTDGIDTVTSYRSISLLSPNIRGDVENVQVTGEHASATGNALNNKLVGDVGNTVLNGMGGDDLMQGRRGNDTYIVDTLNDIVDETYYPGGIDTVRSLISYTLTDTVHVKGAVENLTLIGAALTAEGNALKNEITGNAFGNILEGLGGNDVLAGAGGADQLEGGAGSDTYVLGGEASGVDEVIDSGGGGDTIMSSINRSLGFGDYSEIENLTLLGNAITGIGGGFANAITGNARANSLLGLAGNDKLLGGLAGDRLNGGAGADQFIFNSVVESRVGFGCDFIVDFSRAQGDRIVLSTIDANTGAAGNQAFTFIGAAAFTKKAGQLRYQKADGNTYLQGDVNGDGLADLTIISDLPLSFARTDFVL